jgi:hypothetical protein
MKILPQGYDGNRDTLNGMPMLLICEGVVSAPKPKKPKAKIKTTP